MSVRARLIGALQRAIGEHDEPARSPLDEALMFRAHERAHAATENAMRLSQGAGATAAQHKNALDAAADQARMLAARGRDARLPTDQLRDSLERAKLIALNAGLEGARMGEPSGRALANVADEMRAIAGRALEALEQHLAMLAQVERDREKLLAQIEQTQQRARELADELLRSQAAQREAEIALAEIGNSLAKSSATDPETARALTEAAEHARGLMRSLSVLTARGDPAVAAGALGPALKPLWRALRELYRGGSREPSP
jgi:methyl-accepting chemotaxis protein